MAKTKEEKTEKKDKINYALDSLNSKFGAGSVFKIGDHAAIEMGRIPTGSIGLDYLTSGGWPIGRVVEIRGWESAGKSLVCLMAAAQVQKMDKKVLYIDFEHALNLPFAEKLGVNTKELLLCQPSYMEEGFEIFDTMIDTGEIGMVVVDSISSMSPKSELEGDINQASIGLISRGMSQFMRRITAKLSNTNATAFFVGQYREKIGVSYGDNRSIVGGNSLKYSASVVLDLRKSTKEKAKDGEVTGNRVVATALKCKVGVPFRETEYLIEYGIGIEKNMEIAILAEEIGFITKNGSWFKYGETSVGQGINGVRQTLQDNPELAEELEGKIRENYGI